MHAAEAFETGMHASEAWLTWKQTGMQAVPIETGMQDAAAWLTMKHASITKQQEDETSHAVGGAFGTKARWKTTATRAEQEPGAAPT